MRTGVIAGLAVCGVAAVAGGWYFGTATTPSEQTSVPAAGLMFPALAARLGNVSKVEITHQATTLIIEKRADGPWGVASLHDYPVLDTKVRGLLTGLTELRLMEPRTSDPAEFSRLGVDDPAKDGSTANLLRLLDRSGTPILAVIVGHKRMRSEGGLAEDVYVRRPDENQSWLAEGSLQVDTDPALWLDRDVLNIGHDKIASAVVGDRALVFESKDGKFALTEPAEHPKLEDYRVDDVSRALELLTFQSVKSDADLTATETAHALFTTTDGLEIAVRVFHADKDVWVRFTASGIGAAKTVADQVNVRLTGWSYQIGSWKEKSLVPTMDDLKAADPSPAPAAEAPK